MDPEDNNNANFGDEENHDAPDPESEDQFQDEPLPESKSSGAYNPKGDPLKWNPTPTTIKLLILLNLIIFGAVAFIVWWAVDRENENSRAASVLLPTPPPTMAPTKTTAPSVSPSARPSASPSAFPSRAPTQNPSAAPSSMPSFVPSLAPSISPSSFPTPIFSEAPTRGEFFCDLCGSGKDITAPTGEVPFGSRLTRSCSELATDATNGDIVEEQCEALYPLIVDVCACRSTETLATRTDTSVRALFETVVGSEINTPNSDKDRAADTVLASSYYTQVKDFATDNELIQRYLLTLAFFQTNIESQLPSLGGVWECEWNGVTCEYGQVLAVNFTSFGMSGAFPGDMFAIANIASIDLSSNAIAGSLPTEIGQATQLTKLDISSNALSGNVPSEFYRMTKLIDLNMANNQFSGPISSDIDRFTNLDSLNIGANSFTGTLPTCSASSKPSAIEADCQEITCTCCTTCTDSIVV